jgi:roadblock/LC7 domain-containing protein
MEAPTVDNSSAMTAGDSAREQARQLSEVSEVLRRKSEWASKRSANFAAGATGEKALAEAFAPLTAKGWYPLYDRASPSGGNIDLLVVGPAGVAVIDAKSWSGAVMIDGTKLLLGDRSRAKDLNGVRRQVAEVEADRAERQGKLWRPCCDRLGRGSHEARRALIRFSARQGGCALLLAGRDERQLTQSGKSEQRSNDLQSAVRLVFCSVRWRHRRSPRSR